jgi:CBS domain-containing protein
VDRGDARVRVATALDQEETDMKVSDIMSRRVDLIDPGTTIAEAARTMRKGDLGCLLIGRDEQVFGIVTDRDLVVRALANGMDPTRARVSDVMSTEVLSCFEDQPVENVAQVIATHGVRRLPVLDRRGRLTGVVSLSDVRGGELRKNKPYEVTFYKQLTDGCGTLHEVPIRTVYVAAVDGEEEAVSVATEILKRALGPRSTAGCPGRLSGHERPLRAASERRPERAGAQQRQARPHLRVGLAARWRRAVAHGIHFWSCSVIGRPRGALGVRG